MIQPDAVAAIIRNEKGHNQVREMLKPGTSALFMVVEQMTTDKAVDALSKYGGTVLKTSLSDKAEKQLQDALHGEQQSLATQMNRASWPQTVR